MSCLPPPHLPCRRLWCTGFAVWACVAHAAEPLDVPANGAGARDLAAEVRLAYDLVGLLPRNDRLIVTTVPGDVHGSAPLGPSTVLDYELVWPDGAAPAGAPAAVLQLDTRAGPVRAQHALVLPPAAQSPPLRLDTALQVERGNRTLQFGDAITRPGSLGPARRFGGLQWGTDRALDAPYDARFAPHALPRSPGSSVLPRALDVLVEQAQARIAPPAADPGTLRQLPAVRAGGDVLIALPDVLGRTRWTSVPLAVGPSLMPAGVTSFGVAAGWQRRGYGLQSHDYGAPLAQLSWRRGVTSSWTGEAQAEVDENALLLAGGASTALGRVGLLGVSALQLHEAVHTHTAYGASFGHQDARFAFVATAQWRARAPAPSGPADELLPPRREFAARASVALGGHLTLAAGGVLAAQDDDSQDTLLSASVITRVLRDGSVEVSAVHAVRGSAVDGVVLSLTLPLGPQARAAAIAPGRTAGRMDLQAPAAPRPPGP